MNKNDKIQFLSLASIQAANALFPLACFPYFLKIFGEENFSIIVTAEALSFYVLAFSLYSFDINGVKKVREFINLEDFKNIYRLYFDVIFVRLFIFAIISSVLLTIVYFCFFKYFSFFMIWLFFPLGLIFQSNYYYQAVEKSNILAAYVLFSRFVSVFLVYLMVRSVEDAFLAVSFISLSYFFSGLLAFFHIVRENQFKIQIPSMTRLCSFLYEGRSIFSGNLSVALFRSSGVLVLSAVTKDPDSVSYYSISEKYIKMLQAISRPLNQIYFIKTVRALSNSENERYIEKIWLNTRNQILVMLFIVFVFFVLVIFDIFLFNVFFEKEIFYLMFFMSFAIFFGISNYMFGSVGLNILGFDKYYADAVTVSGFFSVIMCSVLCWFFEEYGAAISFTMAELILLLFVLKKLNKQQKIK